MIDVEAPTKPWSSRTTTRCPADKITVIEIDEDGFPTEKKGKSRMRRLACLVAHQHLPLVLDSKQDKNRLFDEYCLPKLEFPEALRDLAKK